MRAGSSRLRSLPGRGSLQYDAGAIPSGIAAEVTGHHPERLSIWHMHSRYSVTALFGLALAAGLLIFAFVPSGESRPGTAGITLDPGMTYQIMRGWEATSDLPADPLAAQRDPSRLRLIERLAEEVGINRVRIEIRAGAETATRRVADHIAGHTSFKDWKDQRYLTENDNSDPFEIDWAGFDFAELDWHVENSVLPLREALARRGERLFVNLCYVAFRRDRYHQLEPEEYAELVLATYLHLDGKYGFVPDSWEVVLEPDARASKELWTGERIGQAIGAAARRLAAQGFTPSFVAPSVTSMGNAVRYLDGIARMPGALEHLSEVSYHRYGGRTAENLRRIAGWAADHALPTAMLEWWFGRATHEVLYRDLVTGNVSAWQGRVMPGHFRDWNRLGADAPLQEEVRFNRHYFQAARLGAVRIGARSTAPDEFAPVAFIDPDGGYSVVVMADRAGEITVHGLPPGRYRIAWTTDEADETLPGVRLPTGGALATRIPDRGVLSILAI